jgi:hypothetical protein
LTIGLGLGIPFAVVLLCLALFIYFQHVRLKRNADFIGDLELSKMEELKVGTWAPLKKTFQTLISFYLYKKSNFPADGTGKKALELIDQIRKDYRAKIANRGWKAVNVTDADFEFLIAAFVSGPNSYIPSFTGELSKDVDDEMKAFVLNLAAVGLPSNRESFTSRQTPPESDISSSSSKMNYAPPIPTSDRRQSMVYDRRQSVLADRRKSVFADRRQSVAIDRRLSTTTDKPQFAIADRRQSIAISSGRRPSSNAKILQDIDDDDVVLEENNVGLHKSVEVEMNSNEEESNSKYCGSSMPSVSESDLFPTATGLAYKSRDELENPERNMALLNHETITDYIEMLYMDWNIDFFDLSELSCGHSLYFTALWLTQQLGILTRFKIEENVMKKWLLVSVVHYI